MAYFDNDFLDFFEGLSNNNNKDWFHNNKKIYEQKIKKPFYQLINDVIETIQTNYDKDLDLEVKNAVFRINRDIRFSKDKTPYKTHVAAVVSRGGRKDLLYPGLYIHLGLGELSLGGGCYQPDKHILQSIREHIATHPKKLNAILNNKEFKDTYGGIKGAKNKRLPKEFIDVAESIPLIANKQFYVMANYSSEHILREDLLDFIIQHYEVSTQWNSFLKEAMKLS